MYACFIDFKQAFDSVSREQLWHRLLEIGLCQGPFLDAIKSLYSSTEFSVKIGQSHSRDTYSTTRGVKQGCPLSPLLFGLIMDKLFQRIQQDCPDVGIPLLDNLRSIVSHIMYADDVVLFARTEHDLQRLVDALQVFCAEVELKVNKSKSVVMVFEARASHRAPLSISLGQEVLQSVESFKYLGVPFHCTKWLNEASQSLAQAASRAVWALWKGAQSRGIVCRDTLLRIFKTQVLPIALYSASVWGQHHLSVAHGDSILSSPTQEVQNLFLCLISKASDHTSRWILHRNVDLQPVQLAFFQAATRLWSSLRVDAPLLRIALCSDIALFLKGHTGCWSHQLLKQCQQVGMLPSIGRLELEHFSVD